MNKQQLKTFKAWWYMQINDVQHKQALSRIYPGVPSTMLADMGVLKPIGCLHKDCVT